MGVPGQRQGTRLRIAIAQSPQSRAQTRSADDTEARSASSSPAGFGGSRRQLPDPLQLPARRHPGDISLSFVGQRSCGGSPRPPRAGDRSPRALPAPAPSQRPAGGATQIRQARSEPDELCQAQAGVAIRHPEGQAGDALCRDGKARFLQPKAAMVRIEAEGVAGTTGVAKAYESPPPRSSWPGIVQGPGRRHCYLAVAERRHAFTRWPGFTREIGVPLNDQRFSGIALRAVHRASSSSRFSRRLMRCALVSAIYALSSAGDRRCRSFEQTAVMAGTGIGDPALSDIAEHRRAPEAARRHRSPGRPVHSLVPIEHDERLRLLLRRLGQVVRCKLAAEHERDGEAVNTWSVC